MNVPTTTPEGPVLPLVPPHEETLLREAVSGIAAGFGPEYIREKVEAEAPPTELWEALAERGYLGVNIPEEYDGGGRGMTELAAVGEELSKAGCPLLLLLVSPAIAGSVLARHGTPEQKERWLRGIGRGDLRVAFAITEPDAGTNTHNLSTRAERRNGSYVLHGTKTFISGVEDAHAILVVARTGTNEESGRGLLSLFIVDSDAPGLDRQPVPTAARQADRQWQLFFDGVEVSADRLVGPEHAGLAVVFDGLNPERIMTAALAIGAGRRALAQAAEYARERVVWNAPIGAHQGISHPLAEAKIELELAALMNRKACALYDAGAKGAGEASNIAKYAAVEAAIHSVDQAIQTHGGNGVALEYGLSDMWWGVRTMRIAPVSREMILNYVAEHSLGLPRSY
ncbi:MAG TPA: acyl-CoA dehydrogenase family protein [Solirubrobacteraceae bacterium]|nr:acyl-CoA dehydrogenase family protein [Solirubrobacteraceae bacterium]